jgi:hypothetical protein
MDSPRIFGAETIFIASPFSSPHVCPPPPAVSRRIPLQRCLGRREGHVRLTCRRTPSAAPVHAEPVAREGKGEEKRAGFSFRVREGEKGAEKEF